MQFSVQLCSAVLLSVISEGERQGVGVGVQLKKLKYIVFNGFKQGCLQRESYRKRNSENGSSLIDDNCASAVRITTIIGPSTRRRQSKVNHCGGNRRHILSRRIFVPLKLSVLFVVEPAIIKNTVCYI